MQKNNEIKRELQVVRSEKEQERRKQARQELKRLKTAVVMRNGWMPEGGSAA